MEKLFFERFFLEKLAVALIFPRNNSIIFEPNNIIKANQDHGSCTVKIAARVKALLLIQDLGSIRLKHSETSWEPCQIC